MYTQLGEQKRSPGATGHLVNNNTIVDSGMGLVNNKKDENYFPVAPQKPVDLIIVTHSHLDHCGNLPTIAKNNPNAVILMTQPGVAGTYIILNDALKINIQDQKNAEKEGGGAKPLPYNRKDIYEVFRRIHPIPKPGWCSVGSNRIGFYSSGHMRGAAMIFLIPKKGPAYFFTGDISSHDQPLVKGVMLPPKEFFGDELKEKSIVMVTETTYGNRALPKPMPELQKDFQALMKQTAQKRIQSFLPSFATKGPDVIQLLIDAGIIPHVDGLIQDFCQMYAKNTWCEQDIAFKLKEFVAKKLVILYKKLDGSSPQEEHENEERHRIETALGNCCGLSYPSPIVSSSAMLDKGRSVQHAERILPNRKATVVFTGHMFPGSVGEEVLRIEKGRTVKLNTWDSNLRKNIEKQVPVSCEVEHFGLSGHDEGPKLLERVARFQELCPKLGAELLAVIGHHGDDENYAGFERGVNALGLGIPVFHGEHLKEIRL